MSACLRLLWYHGRLGLSWSGLAPLLTLASALGALSVLVPLHERRHDLGVILEVGLPLLAGLLAVPLLLAEQERNTLVLLAVRAPLARLVMVRLALLAVYLLWCCGLALLVARGLWGGPMVWAALPRAAAPGVTFATLGLLAAHGGRSTVHGYLVVAAVWVGALVSPALLPHSEPWLTLDPFGWTNGLDATVVARGKVLDTLAALALVLPQWPLLRPERLLGQS